MYFKQVSIRVTGHSTWIILFLYVFPFVISAYYPDI